MMSPDPTDGRGLRGCGVRWLATALPLAGACSGTVKIISAYGGQRGQASLPPEGASKLAHSRETRPAVTHYEKKSGFCSP